MTLVINYWGGPGSGKSTRAAEHFVALKKAGVNAELVREYAKDLVYLGILEDKRQFDITREQCTRQKVLLDKVDVIVTDSPLLIGAVYSPDADQAQEWAWNCWRRFRNISYWLPSGQFAFQSEGRVQDEQAALDVGFKMREFMDANEISYERLNAHDPIPASTIG